MIFEIRDPLQYVVGQPTRVKTIGIAFIDDHAVIGFDGVSWFGFAGLYS
jgi:hypothetical protein